MYWSTKSRTWSAHQKWGWELCTKQQLYQMEIAAKTLALRSQSSELRSNTRAWLCSGQPRAFDRNRANPHVITGAPLEPSCTAYVIQLCNSKAKTKVSLG